MRGVYKRGASPNGRWSMRRSMSMAEQLRWKDMLMQSWEPRQWFEDDGETPRIEQPRGEERVMWVYREEQGDYLVGFYDPDKTWHSESRHATAESAAGRVRWLNGGG